MIPTKQSIDILNKYRKNIIDASSINIGKFACTKEKGLLWKCRKYGQDINRITWDVIEADNKKLLIVGFTNLSLITKRNSNSFGYVILAAVEDLSSCNLLEGDFHPQISECLEKRVDIFFTGKDTRYISVQEENIHLLQL